MNPCSDNRAAPAPFRRDGDETAEARQQGLLTPTIAQLEALGQLRLIP